jgi:TolB-like protein
MWGACLLLSIHSLPAEAQILISVPVVQGAPKADAMRLNQVLQKSFEDARILTAIPKPETLKRLSQCGKKVRCILAVAKTEKAPLILHTIVGKKNQTSKCRMVLISVKEKKPVESVIHRSDKSITEEALLRETFEKLKPVLAKRNLVAALPKSPPPSPTETPTEAKFKGSVMVLGLRSVGIDQSDADALTHRIATVLGRRKELKSISKNEIKEVLLMEKNKQLLGCDADEACLAQVRNISDVDYVLSGSIGKIAESYVMNMSLVHVQDTKTVAQTSLTMTKISELDQQLDAELGKLFGWSGASMRARFKLEKGQETTFAILDLKATGVSKETSANLTQILSAEIKQVEGTKVIGREDLLAVLSTEKMAIMLGAECDTSCMAELGGALGADKLIAGHVGKVGERYVVALRLIDPVTISVDSRSTESFEGQEKLLIKGTRAAARSLIGVSSDLKGTLIVSASTEDALISLNGKLLGKHPLPPIENIDPGRYRLRVQKPGYYDWRSDVYVDPGEDTAMWADLKPVPKKWYEKWWVWTIILGTAAGASTGISLLTADAPPNPTQGGTVSVAPLTISRP